MTDEVEMLPLEDLMQLHQEVADKEAELAAAIERRRNMERLEFRREIIAKCEALGTTPADLFGFHPSTSIPAPASGNGKKRSRSQWKKGEPKYRNPDNPAQTWPGHGRAPAWVGMQKVLHGEDWKRVCSIATLEE